ncbi:MAG TPA: XdhC/CoxI family protein [Thermoleophilia bacterium]|nr:XdhC/CoxI family protein [Thermoleophilia bacterium]
MRAEGLYEKVAELTRQGARFVMATITDVRGSSPRDVGTKMLVLRDGTLVESIGGGVLEKQVVADALDCLARGVSRSERYELREEGEHALGALCGGEATVFFDVHAPDRTLLVVGAGHVGQALCRFAALLDFRVVVLDAREDMVSPERFPQADRRIRGDPARTAELFDIDEDTSVVIVTHGHAHDKAALRSVVGSPAAYVGMIGSRNKVRTVFAQLREEGVSPELLGRVHAPIGLDIGAQTPAELALCIMAEVVAVRYGGQAQQGVTPVGEAGGD